MVHIITDSAVDSAAKYREKFTVVPLTVSFGETVYEDGITLTKNEFYKKLVKSKELPKTSQATPDTFERVFRELDGEEAVVITISAELSGTYQSACLASEDYPNIRVIDSRSVSIGSGILAEYAYKCTENGMGLEELEKELVKMREKIGLVAMVDTLKYLKMGGRISGTAAIAGEVLSIKPVITVRDGVLAILGKARGSKKANNFLIEQIRQNGVNYDMPILLGYTGLSDETLQDYIRDSRSLWEGHTDQLECVQLCSVVGTHAGPGAVAVAYFYDN